MKVDPPTHDGHKKNVAGHEQRETEGDPIIRNTNDNMTERNCLADMTKYLCFSMQYKWVLFCIFFSTLFSVDRYALQVVLVCI